MYIKLGIYKHDKREIGSWVYTSGRWFLSTNKTRTAKAAPKETRVDFKNSSYEIGDLTLGINTVGNAPVTKQLVQVVLLIEFFPSVPRC